MATTTDPVRQAIERARYREESTRQDLHEAIARCRDQLQRLLTDAAEVGNRVAAYTAWLDGCREPAEPDVVPCAMAPFADAAPRVATYRITDLRPWQG